jgi:hypothetical protein
VLARDLERDRAGLVRGRRRVDLRARRLGARDEALEELVEEELAELGWKGKVPTIRHFRDDAKLYTFENALPAGVTGDAALVAKFLFAYEAAFRALGDVGGGDEE